MEYPNRVKDTTTTEGTGNITVAGTPPSTYVALGAKVANGKKFPYGLFHRALNEWEIGTGTMLTATTFSRAPSDSSNGGALVNFSVGTKDVLCVVGGADFAKIHRTVNIPVSTILSFDAPGHTIMAQQNVTGAITFTVGANPVQDSHMVMRLVASGVAGQVPSWPAGFLQHTGSGDYDNRAGILNLVESWYDGAYFWYAYGQAVGAVPVDSIAPTILSAAVANATPSVVRLTMSEAIDSAYPAAAASVAVGGHASAAGNVTISGIYVDVPLATPFVYGEAARTLVYTQPGTNNLRDIAGNLLGTTGTPVAITNNLAAPATKPATMAAPTATAGQLSASIAFVAPANGGSAITGYTVTASTGQTATGTTSPISITMPAGSATFTIKATNAIGTGDPSPASNQVTVSSAATVPAAPTIGTAVAGDGYIDVAFTRNSDGGSAVIDSTATLSTGQTATGTTSPIRVTAPNGTAATATVKDRNAVGLSAASAASNSVTPAAAGAGYPRLTNLTGITESGTGPYSYAGTDKAFSDTFGGISSTGLPANGDGWLSFVIGNYGSAKEPMLGVTTGTTVVPFGSLPCAVYPQFSGNKYVPWTNGTLGTPTNTVIPADGDVMRLRRSGTSIIAEVSKDSAATWTTIYTWTGQTTAALRFEVIPEFASQANTLAASGLS